MSSLNLRAIAVLFSFALWNGASMAQGLDPQTSKQSFVTVKVSLQDLKASIWEFDIVFDTHSQELTDDLVKSAVLIGVDGTQVSPVAWVGDEPGGHHRQGVLRFNALTPRPAKLEMRINRPGEEKPRSFQWVLP